MKEEYMQRKVFCHGLSICSFLIAGYLNSEVDVGSPLRCSALDYGSSSQVTHSSRTNGPASRVRSKKWKVIFCRVRSSPITHLASLISLLGRGYLGFEEAGSIFYLEP